MRVGGILGFVGCVTPIFAFSCGGRSVHEGEMRGLGGSPVGVGGGVGAGAGTDAGGGQSAAATSGAGPTGGGGRPSSDVPTCPSERPILGAACTAHAGHRPLCPYTCDETNEETNARCARPNVWLYDGVCAGDCSPQELALHTYAFDSRPCQTSADCRYFHSRCGMTTKHCSGAFVVGPTADDAELRALDDALSACANGAASWWSCSRCADEPPPLVCNSVGRCVESE
jgi:hypothetical protein